MSLIVRKWARHISLFMDYWDGILERLDFFKLAMNNKNNPRDCNIIFTGITKKNKWHELKMGNNI